MEATRIKLEPIDGASGGKCVLDAVAGSLLPGDEVLVGPAAAGGARLIGRISSASRPSGFADQGRPRLTRIVSATRKGDALAQIDGASGRVVLKLPRGDSPVPGARYAAVLIDVLRDGRPLMSAVSSALP
ncbi:MAG: hypothetical protein QOK10_2816 [Pseudonocardiales bacterium]|jgi:hypothetical protein|nr:hypothetical protein [Pseudonocardiales bacterium]